MLHTEVPFFLAGYIKENTAVELCPLHCSITKSFHLDQGFYVAPYERWEIQLFFYCNVNHHLDFRKPVKWLILHNRGIKINDTIDKIVRLNAYNNQNSMK